MTSPKVASRETIVEAVQISLQRHETRLKPNHNLPHHYLSSIGGQQSVSKFDFKTYYIAQENDKS
jgi:hypothetical protein